MKKKILILFIILISISCNADKSSQTPLIENNNIQKIDMDNLKYKMNYLIKNLDTGKKYPYNENKKFLEYILIGKWHSPPHEVYNFKKNNVFVLKNFKTMQVEKGKWNLVSDGIELHSKSIKEKKKISYFILEKEKDKPLYGLSIVADDFSFLLDIDTDIIKIWEKHPPLP